MCAVTIGTGQARVCVCVCVCVCARTHLCTSFVGEEEDGKAEGKAHHSRIRCHIFTLEELEV